ncbi:MAG: thioredoxin family protein [Candidatus Magasanikbacteria bacterium]
MLIKILGSGCANCKRLEENTKKAIADLNLQEAIIEKITDMGLIMDYGIMSTPALVIDEQILSYGCVPDVSEIKDILNNTAKSSRCGCGSKC